MVLVESTDGSGNLGFAEVRFTVDTVAPIINIAAPVAGVTNDNRPVLNYTVSVGTVVVKVNGNIVNKVSGDALDTLPEGYAHVRVESTDAAGNSAYADVVFTVDTTPPAVIITSPASGVVRSNQPSLYYTVYEGTVVVKVDGAVVNKVSGDRLDTLADGSHTVRVECTDAALHREELHRGHRCSCGGHILACCRDDP